MPCAVLFALLLLALAPGGLRAQGPDPGRAEMDRIERYFNHGRGVRDFTERNRYLNYSIEAYKNFLQNFPGHPAGSEAAFNTGYALQTMGRPDEALRSYVSTIQRFDGGPHVGAAARRAGYLSEARKDYRQAASFFQTAARELTDAPLRASSLAKQAHNLLRLDDIEGAMKVLSSIMDDPGNPQAEWARFTLGYQYYLAENHELAVNTLDPLAAPGSTSPYRGRAMFYTGLSAAEQGDDQRAELYLRKMLDIPAKPGLEEKERAQLDDSKALAQTALMGMMLKKENFQGVIDMFHSGTFPTTPATSARRSMRLGQAYFQLKRYANARAAFSSADRSLPNTTLAFDASYYCLLCDYELKDPGLPDRVNAFLKIYRGMDEDSTSFQMAKFLKAETLFDYRLGPEAADTYREIKVEKIDPLYRPRLLFKAGWAVAETGDHPGAVRYLSDYLSQFPADPDRPAALFRRAESYLALADRRSALADLDNLLSEQIQGSLRAAALQKKGILLRAEKQYAGMIAAYQQLLTEFPDEPVGTIANANYWIGWAFYQLEEGEKAIPFLDKAIALAPENHLEPGGSLLVLIHHSREDFLAMRDAINNLHQSYPTKYIPDNLLKWLGFRLYHAGEFKDAARFLGIVLSTSKPEKRDTEVWRLLAKANNETGNYQKALEAAENLLALEEENPLWQADTHLDLALARLGLDQLDEAQKSVAAGLAIDVPGPHLAGLQLAEGRIALARKNYPEASAAFEKTLSLLISDPHLKPLALHLAALAAEKQNLPQKAATYQTQLQTDFPTWKPEEKNPESRDQNPESQTSNP